MSSMGTIELANKHLQDLDEDYLYHLGIKVDLKNKKDIQQQFGDVRILFMGGTAERMLELARYTQRLLNIHGELVNICAGGKRYAVYKVGRVMFASHGIGMPSMSILLHEMAKLFSYAGCKDPIFIRVGSSGGVGVPPGTVVVTKEAYNGYLKQEYELPILGEKVCRPAKFCKEVYEILYSCSEPNDNFKVVLGNTLAADDFYEGQARLDGAVCNYNKNDKMEFLKRIHREFGISNFEMEATMFSSLTHAIGIKAGEVCVAFLDRLKGDQVIQATQPTGDLELNAFIIVGRFIKKILN